MSLMPSTLARKITEDKISEVANYRVENTKLFVNRFIGLKIIDAARQGKHYVDLSFRKDCSHLGTYFKSLDSPDKRIPEFINYNDLDLGVMEDCVKRAGYEVTITKSYQDSRNTVMIIKWWK